MRRMLYRKKRLKKSVEDGVIWTVIVTIAVGLMIIYAIYLFFWDVVTNYTMPN